MTAPTHLLVAIPARDEAPSLGRCIHAIHVAADRVRADRGLTTTVRIVVAADACTDDTADIARASGASVVETRYGRVGGARAAAISAGLELLASDAATTWIANTDADSTVGPEWLLIHLAAAAAGADVLLGSVRIDPATADHALLARWLHLNPPAHEHRYIHGANLGFRADAYLASGGFRDTATDEDVELVERLRGTGRFVTSTDLSPVLTSGRIVGRAPGGFAAYLGQWNLTDP